MTLPFTLDEFLDVFRRYNEGVWPMQWLLIVVGLIAIVAAFQGGRTASRFSAAALASLWIWMGVVYHIAYFRSINPMALVFGIAFVAQGVLVAWLGMTQISLRYDPHADVPALVGFAILFYAVIGYPLLANTIGHHFPSSPTFGTPCPTTIFTLGLVLLSNPPRSRAVIVIPVLWAVVALVAALQLGMWEDIGLAIAAIIATIIITRQRPHSDESPVGLAAETG